MKPRRPLPPMTREERRMLRQALDVGAYDVAGDLMRQFRERQEKKAGAA